MNIYVGNLPYSVTDSEVREAFSSFGEVSQVNLITDKFTGESKGFGFVEMDNNSEGDAAIKGLNGTDMKGRNITVNQAKPRAEEFWMGRLRDAAIDGDVDYGSLMAGQSVGLVEREMSVEEIMNGLVSGAEEELQKVRERLL